MASMLKKSEGIEQSRRRQRFSSHSNSYSSANSQRIRIDVNTSDEYLDLANSYLVFDMVVAGATTGVGLPRYTASSFIKEIRIKDRSGGLIGENIQDYSVLARSAFEMNVNDEAEKSYYDVLEGATGVALATATGIASRQYAHRIVSSIFASKNYFPAHLLGGISLELDMKAAQNVVLQTSGETGATYTINNLALVCDLVKLKPEVETMILNQVQSGGLTVDYVSHHTVKATIQASSGGQRFDLGSLNGRVKSLTSVQIIAAANASVDELLSFPHNNTSHYRFKLGSRYLSESQVECGAGKQAEYVMEYLKSQKVNCNQNIAQYGNATNLNGTKLFDTKFVIGQQADRSNTDSVLSSLKDKDSNRLELELTYSSAPTAATLYVFVEMDKRLVIFPGRQHQDNDFQGQGTMM